MKKDTRAGERARTRTDTVRAEPDEFASTRDSNVTHDAPALLRTRDEQKAIEKRNCPSTLFLRRSSQHARMVVPIVPNDPPTLHIIFRTIRILCARPVRSAPSASAGSATVPSSRLLRRRQISPRPSFILLATYFRYDLHLVSRLVSFLYLFLFPVAFSSRLLAHCILDDVGLVYIYVYIFVCVYIRRVDALSIYVLYISFSLGSVTGTSIARASESAVRGEDNTPPTPRVRRER